MLSLSRRELFLIGLVIALALTVFWGEQENGKLRSTIAQRAAVQEKSDVKEIRRREEGPRTIRRRFQPPAAGCPEGKPVLAEETIEEGPSLFTVDRETDTERSEEGPELPQPRKRFAGVMISGENGKRVYGLRAGYTVWDRLDLGVGWVFEGPWRGPRAELAVRF